MTVELRLLSQVTCRGREITARRLRDLLALLAADLPAGCGTGRLVDGLWPDEQPENPVKALQILVSRARAQLGADLIASTPTGYRLTLRPDQVDATALHQHAAAARSGDPRTALAEAEAGLRLWDGSADDGLGPLSALRREHRPAHRFLVRARGLALSRLGRHAEAAEPLAEAARERPRDEEVLLELLRSESATAGPSAALARYETYRRAVRDDLGTDPGAELQAWHRETLAASAPVARHGIPHEPNPLLGRADDLAAIRNLLRRSRVTTIAGPGGLGKTRVAHAVGRAAEQPVVHFVPLAAVRADEDVVRHVATALGVGGLRRSPSPVPRDELTGIAEVLGAAPALLILDNCEQVLDGVAELVGSLVSMTRDLRVLTTSRAPLALSSESVYPLPELDLSATVELFTERAGAARPDADLPEGAVTELCRRLDGLPLAVELAAARVRVLSVTEIARRLTDRFALLRGGPRDAPQRHRTLEAVVDWSWHLLDEPAQAALRALSVFPGGFTEDSARHLLGEGDTLDVLDELSRQSLLKVSDTATGTRFRMLETVREFAAARLAEAGGTARVTGDFLAWARDFGLAHHEPVFVDDPAGATERIRAERDNLAAALRLGLERADGPTVAATTAALGALWVFDSNFNRLAGLTVEVPDVLARFRPQPEFVEVTRTAAAVCTSATFMLRGPRAVRSLVVLRRLPAAPPTTVIRALSTVLCAFPEIMLADRRALNALCDSDFPLLAYAARAVDSYRWETEGDAGEALAAALRMLEAAEDAGGSWLRLMAHARVGELYLQRGDAASAARHLRVATRLLEDLTPWPDTLGIRWGLMLAALQAGEVDEAERLLAGSGSAGVEDRFDVLIFDMGVRAEVALARNEVERGLALWRQALARQRDSGFLGLRDAAGLDSWTLELISVTVVAHAQHGRLDLVADLVGELPALIPPLFSDRAAKLPAYLIGMPVRGAVLVAAGMVALDRGDTSGVRLIALGERLGFLRNFQPTMSPAGIRAAAENADGPAYSDAVSAYAGLGPADLLAAALDLVSEPVRG
ncbi:ATP-binding protein [Amycolatopsis thermophila]|uniref:ATPase/DNA-binding SARP family transcriptional activator n=1 Tax=Amycolatopsis thermophila TaxID=206084 RepID=A0ABU0EY79_9PSEU|nr:BTAD domain-containing putative transcriptional regulator [Amycolatopsis thermophila]MDQ0379732.1 putative ATPase/DNA-binding SARP family transcriptional activator [Amycolatopsis thermophila]